MTVIFSQPNKEELTHFDDEKNVYECLVALFKRLGGRPIATRFAGYCNTHKMARLAGLKNRKLFEHLLVKALERGFLAERNKEHLYGFTDTFRSKLFGEKKFDHHGYMRPIVPSGILTDQNILLLLCWYRDGRAFNFCADLTTELSDDIGLKNSFELRLAVERLLKKGHFNTLQCEGDIEMLLFSTIFCAFKEQTVQTAFANAKQKV